MSSWPNINHAQAKTLARFLHELRGDWDVAGIEAQLGHARGMAPAPFLAIAAIKAAMAGSNRTPAVIGMQGEHWRSSAAPPAHRQLTPEERCSICNQPRERCRQIAALPDDGHEFTPDVGPQLMDESTGELHPLPDVKAAVAQLRETKFSQQNKEIHHAEHAS